MTSEVQIQGFAELDKFLKQFPAKIEGNIVRASLNAANKVIADEARLRAPVDDGDLRKSIRVSSRIFKRSGDIVSLVRAGNKKAFYAKFIEYGTARYFTGKGTGSVKGPYVIRPKTKKSLFFLGQAVEQVVHEGIKPRPFMRPAFDSKKDEAIQAFARKMKQRIDKEFRKREP